MGAPDDPTLELCHRCRRKPGERWAWNAENLQDWVCDDCAEELDRFSAETLADQRREQK